MITARANLWEGDRSFFYLRTAEGSRPYPLINGPLPPMPLLRDLRALRVKLFLSLRLAPLAQEGRSSPREGEQRRRAGLGHRACAGGDGRAGRAIIGPVDGGEFVG